MDNGREFLILCHSYGGIPGCAATDGFTVEERKNSGKKGGFRAILFIAAFAMPRTGMDLLQSLKGRYPSWMTPHEPFYQKNITCCVNDKGKHCFYNDLPDDIAQQYFNSVVPFSQDAFETPIDFAASDLTIPRTFLICENDLAFPPSVQEELATSILDMKIERCSAGHSPFASQPDRVIEIVKGLLD
ncbi:hypothetical protein K445DRAFT_25976 [Daldinia sp. EC12]|nr:hypothetical protein F4774DRAFT_422018 [Daldinia eschscholtzii]OTB12147.1 hypothetical protein K445DRAFT_25976 [Daldinia sp. EC12]